MKLRIPKLVMKSSFREILKDIRNWWDRQTVDTWIGHWWKLGLSLPVVMIIPFPYDALCTLVLLFSFMGGYLFLMTRDNRREQEKWRKRLRDRYSP